jgi:hypothetical protein
VGRLLPIVLASVVLGSGCRATIELDPGGTLGGCHPAGSVCGEASACCSGACSDGFCAAVEGCRPSGESCASGSDCCSHVCASDGQGRVLCQQLGGCRVAGELCTAEHACCDASSCVALDGASGIGRCTLGGTCGGGGEICRVSGEPDAMRECCDGASGRTQCRGSDVHGIDRCLAPSAECRGEGETCAAPSDCCGGRCVPNESGLLVCMTSCVAGVGRCTSDADCCSGICGLDAHCGPVRDCSAIAETCADDDACCSGLCESGVCSSPLF